jgi:hypothetical protein
MSCSDCGVLATDPGGPRVICLRCARLVAEGASAASGRQPTSPVQGDIG